MDGTDDHHEPVYRRRAQGLGYLAQEPSIFRRLTVRENVLGVLETMKLTQGRAHGAARQLLDDLNLTHLADRTAPQAVGRRAPARRDHARAGAAAVLHAARRAVRGHRSDRGGEIQDIVAACASAGWAC
jgi:lipopolysaccharide export system ATP-binding protein